MTIAPEALTKPQAGVIATSPATIPEQKPSTLALPRTTYSASAQVPLATAPASVVVRKALEAMPSAATALPALNPYQPTHNIPAPTIQKTMLCGAKSSLP